MMELNAHVFRNEFGKFNAITWCSECTGVALAQAGLRIYCYSGSRDTLVSLRDAAIAALVEFDRKFPNASRAGNADTLAAARQDAAENEAEAEDAKS